MSDEPPPPSPAGKQAGGPFDLAGLDPVATRMIDLVLRIASGDFAARGEVAGDESSTDAVVVALNMLAESFQREREARERAEGLLVDAVSAYDLAPDSFCSCEVGSLRIVKCNRTMARVLGLPAAKVLGRSLLDFVAPASRAALGHALDSLLEGTTASETDVELLASGRTVVASLTGSIVKVAADGPPARFLLALRDVTSDRKIEAQLIHAQRMEAVGRLAGGVAHDFNNLLFVVLATSDRLAMRLAGRPDDLENVQVIREAAERCSALTKDLLAFARQETALATPVLVDDVVGKARSILSRLVSAATTLEVVLDAPSASAVIDPGRLGQVLVNLVANARDASPEGGTITVATRRRTLDEAYVREHAEVVAGEYVELTVSDTGPGVPVELQARIFEPFFTTKPVGRGTGLGLATVYGIVRRANGYVTVRSVPGQGATFVVHLPLVGARPSEAPRPVQARSARAVLVIEDDDRVRAITLRILRGAGYRVLEAASGPEALEHLRANPTDVALVVSDIVMPIMDGFQTLAKLRELRSDLPCLFVTGFSHEEGAARAMDRVRVLEKPFVPSTLLANVSALLEA